MCDAGLQWFVCVDEEIVLWLSIVTLRAPAGGGVSVFVPNPVRRLAWHAEGKPLVACHTFGGSLTAGCEQRCTSLVVDLESSMAAKSFRLILFCSSL